MSTLKQPLLHFLGLGVFLFALFTVVGEDVEPENIQKEIVVTPGRIETLVANFKRVWRRDPTAQELEGLIEDFVREEIYYREALAIGLDRDDTIIRRRLRQKMEFITADLSDQLVPEEKELQNYLQENSEAYRKDSIYTLKQIYLDPDKRKDSLNEDIEHLLAHLNADGNSQPTDSLGDRIMLEHSYTNLTESEINGFFGNEFGSGLASQQTGQWVGPLESGYGVHLILIESKVEATVPRLEDIRETVFRDWQSTQRRDTNEKFFKALRKHYTITIDQANG
jgi:parvulin-like peptidyl-prolyl isomerase